MDVCQWKCVLEIDASLLENASQHVAGCVFVPSEIMMVPWEPPLFAQQSCAADSWWPRKCWRIKRAAGSGGVRPGRW